MPSPLPKKLGLKPGQSVLVLDPPGDWPPFSELLAFASVQTRGDGPFDCVLLFSTTRAGIEAHGRNAVAATAAQGLLWVCYPKLTSGVASDSKREAVWEAMNPTGWRPVAQIAMDDTWSALRFRPASAARSKSAAAPRKPAAKPRPKPRAKPKRTTRRSR